MSISLKRKNCDKLSEEDTDKTSSSSNYDSNIKDQNNETPKNQIEDAAKEKVEESSKPKRKRKRKKKSHAIDKSITQSLNTGAKECNPTQILSPDSTASAAQIREAMMMLSNQEVYVEGLPFQCSEDDVKEFFSEGGCSDVIQMRLPRWQDSGRLRGYGHIVFSTTKSRDKAIKSLSGKYLKNRYITIAPSKQPRSSAHSLQNQQNNNHEASITQPKNCCTIFVKNLPYDVTESELETTFRKYGEIAKTKEKNSSSCSGSVRLALNSITRKPKGFGYVQFQNPEGALAAVKQANSNEFGGGITMKGRILYVDFEEGGMKMSFKTREGKLWSKEYKK